jgi:hypothetical protein
VFQRHHVDPPAQRRCRLEAILDQPSFSGRTHACGAPTLASLQNLPEALAALLRAGGKVWANGQFGVEIGSAFFPFFVKIDLRVRTSVHLCAFCFSKSNVCFHYTLETNTLSNSQDVDTKIVKFLTEQCGMRVVQTLGQTKWNRKIVLLARERD